MITYERLTRRPQVAPSLIGMRLAEFDALYREFEVRHEERRQSATVTRRTGEVRQRAVGAGHSYRYELRDRLLLTLFWLRAYTTYEVLGFFYDLNKTNIEDILKDILTTLEQMSTFSFELPGPERRKLRTPDAVLEHFPEVRLIVDSKEQRIERPKPTKGDDGTPQDPQKPYYSGKKKAHTLKTQVAVGPDGLIEAVSDSVPGGANHDLTLLRQTGLLDQLAPDEAVMVDKGYHGLRKSHPDHQIVQPFKARRNHPLTEDEKAHNRLVAHDRILVEHTLARMNNFQVLAQVFRHQRTAHSQLVRIVGALVNRQIIARFAQIPAAA